MIIKLKNILTIYISPDHNEKYHNRKIHMDNLLTKLGFTNIIHYISYIFVFKHFELHIIYINLKIDQYTSLKSNIDIPPVYPFFGEKNHFIGIFI